MSTSRPVEKAFERILDFIVEHAPDLPVVFIGTKKDRYLKADADLSTSQVLALETGRASKADLEADAARDQEKKASWKRQLDLACPEATQTLLMEWTFLWRGKSQLRQDTRSESLTAPGNEDSIKKLMKLTLDTLPATSVRSGLAAAQVIDRELKIESAIDSTMTLLRTAISASNAAAMTVILNRIVVPTYSRLLCDTIVRCYGLEQPSLVGASESHIDYIMSTVVWRNLGAFMGRSFFAGIGDISVLFVGAPFIEAPVVARMVIKCACDLVIILDRAYQIGGKTAIKETVHRASLEYLVPTRNFTGPSRKQLVHEQVNKLIPAFSRLAIKIYQGQQLAHLRDGIERIIIGNRMDKLPINVDGTDEIGPGDALFKDDTLVKNRMNDTEDDQDLKELDSMGHKSDVNSTAAGMAELSV